MKGSMRERRPVAWELIVQSPRDPVTSASKQLSRTVHGTKREAQRALAALVTEVSAGKTSSSSTTLSQLLVQWIELVSAQLAATTVREYRRPAAIRLGPDLGALTLRRITTQHLDSYPSASLVTGAVPSDVRYHDAVLRGVLGQAVQWGWSPQQPGLRSKSAKDPPT